MSYVYVKRPIYTLCYTFIFIVIVLKPKYIIKILSGKYLLFNNTLLVVVVVVVVVAIIIVVATFVYFIKCILYFL